MNRPYYALAALLALLTALTAAVQQSRCRSAAVTAGAASRSLCGSTARDCVVAASLFAHFEGDCYGGGYQSACGYDRLRGETYYADLFEDDAEEAVPTEAIFFHDNESLADEQEIWPTEQRVEERLAAWKKLNRVCGNWETEAYDGAEVAASHTLEQACDAMVDAWDVARYVIGSWLENAIAARRVPVQFDHNFPCGDWCPLYDDADSTDLACEQANNQFLAEQQALFSSQPADESCFFDDPEAWKTDLIDAPNWIEDYLAEGGETIEQQYAEAELQAARDAGALVDVAARHGRTLRAPPPHRVAYSDEYESLYELDRMLDGDRFAEAEDRLLDEEEAIQRRKAYLSRPLSRLFNQLFEIFDEILPAVEQETDEWFDSADDMIEHWEEISSRLPIPVRDQESLPEIYDDYSTLLPEEAAESREMLESLADGLRLTGRFLLTVADGIDAEAQRILSARMRSTSSR